jgi:hypothetical protein
VVARAGSEEGDGGLAAFCLFWRQEEVMETGCRGFVWIHSTEPRRIAASFVILAVPVKSLLFFFAVPERCEDVRFSEDVRARRGASQPLDWNKNRPGQFIEEFSWGNPTRCRLCDVSFHKLKEKAQWTFIPRHRSSLGEQ